VALSLSATQAERAEAWAHAAGCTVPLLMRQVAQSLRKHLVEAAGVEPLGRFVEARAGRRFHPASVTLTLPESLVQDLSARLDPLGVLGLGRAIGPAFRQRFSSAFDEAWAPQTFAWVSFSAGIQVFGLRSVYWERETFEVMEPKSG